MPRTPPKDRRLFTAAYDLDEWARIEAAWKRLLLDNPRASVSDVVRALARTLPPVD